MPIGNLTSQLFANIYLNEFDRYIRHVVRPLGYVRYGDDFVVLAHDRRAAETIRQQATAWLRAELYLTVHTDATAVFQPHHGAHFLGHRVYPGSFTVEPQLKRRVRREIVPASSASFLHLALTSRERRDLRWILAERAGKHINYNDIDKT